jgi:hypothetical protein
MATCSGLTVTSVSNPGISLNIQVCISHFLGHTTNLMWVSQIYTFLIHYLSSQYCFPYKLGSKLIEWRKRTLNIVTYFYNYVAIEKFSFWSLVFSFSQKTLSRHSECNSYYQHRGQVIIPSGDCYSQLDKLET